MRKILPWLIWLMLGLACAWVFATYLDPHLIVDLGNRVWSCF